MRTCYRHFPAWWGSWTLCRELCKNKDVQDDKGADYGSELAMVVCVFIPEKSSPLTEAQVLWQGSGKQWNGLRCVSSIYHSRSWVRKAVRGQDWRQRHSLAGGCICWAKMEWNPKWGFMGEQQEEAQRHGKEHRFLGLEYYITFWIAATPSSHLAVRV